MTATALTAYEARNWQGVVDALGGDDALTADDLVRKGDALYWLGQYDESVETLERAYAALVDDDRPGEAGLVACLLGYLSGRRQAFAVASGWMARAESLLEGLPPSVSHVWLKILQVGTAMFGEGDPKKAFALVEDALEVAREVGSKSGQSFAMSIKAVGMASSGAWREALGVLDEATVMAMTVGDDLRMTSDVYCTTINLCRNLGDYKRAGEWTEEAERWMRNNSVTAYTGACAVHRAELKRLHGSWQEAEDEARKACVGLEKFHLGDYVGMARYEIGEIRRRMGDLKGAQTEFEKAYEAGHDAQPGLALLQADRGDARGAYESIKGAMGRHVRDPDNPGLGGPSRARLIPSFIDLALAVGDTEGALAAIEDIEEIADIYESKVWKAAGATGRGLYQLETGSFSDAVETLSGAWRLWQEVDLPYETAKTREALGKARGATGDGAAAAMEMKAAISTYQRLGARTDLQRLEDAADGSTDAGADGRVVRTFVFTDIVTSTDLVELIGDEAWHDLLRWHDSALRSAIDDAGGEEVAHTGDGFFAAFAKARDAVDAAVEIQRRLLRHRHEAGFAPKVRIGLHTAEANKRDGNYHGGGVHVAARVAATADGEEILISRQALDSAGAVPYPVSDPVGLDLKGVSEPVEVQKVEWR